jgi:hypothetical protein
MYAHKAKGKNLWAFRGAGQKVLKSRHAGTLFPLPLLKTKKARGVQSGEQSHLHPASLKGVELFYLLPGKVIPLLELPWHFSRKTPSFAESFLQARAAVWLSFP